MEEKSNSSLKKEDVSSEKQSEGSSQKITNFFPILRTEGRAKMCASKSDDSKQKEMVRKMKGKDSMTLRSKKQDKLNEKSNTASTSGQVKEKTQPNTGPISGQTKEKSQSNISSTPGQTKEKIRNVSVSSALKTPLGQVLRKSIEASDKRDSLNKSNQSKVSESSVKTSKVSESSVKTSKVSESSVKTSNSELKKNLSDGESGRMLRQKPTVSEKPVRVYRRKTETNQAPTGNEKVKPEGPARGRVARVTYAPDTVTDEGKSDSTSVNSNSGIKKKGYRKRHFRGSTYGLYLTPARKKKKKMMTKDECKDDEGSVTSTENNSFLDSEDANSLVSEDFFTPSEKSLVDEEQGLESQNFSVVSAEKKNEKLDLNSSVKTEESNVKEPVPKEEKLESKIEISADYEENTQNVTDLFQDLEEMQWESKTDVAENTSSSQNNKLPQYDDISSESFTNALHFAFKKTTEDSEENLTITEKPEESTLVDSSNNCDSSYKSGEKIDLPETSETYLSINDNISEMFNMKDDSNVNLKDDSNVDFKDDSNVDFKDDSNVDFKDDSNVDFKDDSNADMKDDSNKETKEDSNIDSKDDSNIEMKDECNADTKDVFNSEIKDDSNADLKDDSNADLKDDSNLSSSVSSENKVDLNLLTSEISEMKQDLHLSTDMLSNKDSLNLLFDDVDDEAKDDLLSTESKNLDVDSANLQEKENYNLSPHVLVESGENSNEMLCDINEKVSTISPLHVPDNEDINNPDSLLTNEIKQDSNSLSYSDLNKQDSNSLTFTTENKLGSDSIAFVNSNSKHDSNSITFSDKDKQSSNLEVFSNEEKQNSNSLPFANEKDTADYLEFKSKEKKESDFSGVTESNSNGMNDDADQNKDDHFVTNMEVDNVEKVDVCIDDDDDDDEQSTIANCVKSRQRIKRRFTDDIVDTDLGILSVAAMASVKKAMLKQESPKDVIENFQSVTRTEAKKSGSAAKIECVFNYKQSPIKSCTCEGDSFQAKIDKTDEESFCQAVDAIDDKLLGCSNPVVTSRLVRPSVKHPFTVMCETHLWRLKHHHACPYCGLFCSQGSFIQCTGGDTPKSVHLFHEQCQSKEDGTVPFCFHCGSSASLKRVHLELHMASPPSFFLNQTSKVSVPDVSKARISFSESSDFYKKEEDEPALSYKIEESGKILSSAGLPSDSSKEELEKLISMLNEEKVRSYSFTSDEFYDMATTGNVLKVLYMLVKGLDPNGRFPNHEGETALHAASANGHVTVVHLLIQAGAVNDSLNEKMYTPLMLAVENGHKEVVHYLVKKGAITDFKGENGMSSLHLAAKSGNLDVLKILMTSRDTDIDAQDDGGWTPIVWASEHDHLNVVKYLLKRGANPNIRDNEGNIGLHWSAFSGSVEISYLYLDYGCDINAVNELGDTPLHIAARQDSFPCVTLFLSRAADVTILNKAEKLPAECCIDKNSDTYLSLSLNMLLKKITKKYQHKAEKIIHRDISRGKEQIAIQCVNAYDDEMPPLDFLYVTENCETMPIKIDRTITSLQSCHCEDDCSTASCSCASISYQCWYDKEGLLLPEFNLLDPPMLFECNRACSCWSLNCHNRVLQNGITCRLQLIRTKGKGWGVRALKDIPRGAFICEYVGELISDSAADKRADDSYLFDLDNRDGETYCLDARYYGNISRFINHLCEPNLVPVKIYVDHQDLNFPRIAFFSSRDIKQYEELGFDYGEKFWAIKYKSFTCECGAPKCKYSKEVIHITMANYYRRLKEEQMEEAAAAQQQQVEVIVE